MISRVPYGSHHPRHEGRFPLALLIAGGLALPASARAQGNAAAFLGCRVRLTAVQSETAEARTRRVTGVLQRVTADSLVLTAEKGTSLSLPTSAIERIELSQGMRSRAGQGAAIGGLIGGAVGLGAALVFEAAVVGSAESSGIGSGLVIIPAFTLGGAALGLGVGAVVGALSRREEWVTASRPRVSVGVAPRKAAAWLALGIAF